MLLNFIKEAIKETTCFHFLLNFNYNGVQAKRIVYVRDLLVNFNWPDNANRILSLKIEWNVIRGIWPGKERKKRKRIWNPCLFLWPHAKKSKSPLDSGFNFTIYHCCESIIREPTQYITLLHNLLIVIFSFCYVQYMIFAASVFVKFISLTFLEHLFIIMVITIFIDVAVVVFRVN